MAVRDSGKRVRCLPRAVGYLRRSTDRQEQSIPDQRRAIETYAKSNGFRIVDYFIDDAVGGTSTLGRRAFREMIARGQRSHRGWSAIIVYDIKRFGRIDNDEAGYYRHVLRIHGVEVHYTSEGFTGDGTDDLLRPVKQWQARQESKDLAKATIRGLLSKSETGFWMGGTPPCGYDLRYESERGEFLFVIRYVPDGSRQILDEQGKLKRMLARGESLNISKKDRARLAPGASERVAIVQRIFRMYVEEGKGFKAITNTLNREGVPSIRHPGWSSLSTARGPESTIRSIMTNRAYVGDMVLNRRSNARFYKISERRAQDIQKPRSGRLIPNTESEWIVVEDTHPALISRHVYERARQRREERIASRQQRGKRAGGGWHGMRSRFILSGLLSCGACGSRFQGRTANKGTKSRDGSRSKTCYYACGGKIPGVCT